MKISDIVVEKTEDPRSEVKRREQFRTGGGTHKDRKKAAKRGEAKHKKQAVPMEGVAEGKEELHSQLMDINRKLKMMRRGPEPGETNSVAFVDKRLKLQKQKEEILTKLKRTDEDGVAEGMGDTILRKAKVKTTKGKPDPKDMPNWASTLGQTPQGAWHWLEKDGPVETDDSDRYFPLSGKTEFTGFVSEYEGKIDDIDEDGVAEAGRGFRGRSSWDSNMWSGDLGSRDKRSFKRREMEKELGHEDDPDFERKMRISQDKGPWYLLIDGKIYKQKGQPKAFDWKKGANNYGLAIVKNKPELKGKVLLTKVPKDLDKSDSE